MILKRIRLNNYRQHRKVDVTLDGTMIALVGRNGSGKSNFLGAIQFGFTGEQAGFKKADLLSWGAQDGSVVINFEHDGTDCEISRSVSSTSVVFKFGDHTYRGATAVADALKLHIDLDKDLMKQAVFVLQSEIDSILFTDPRIRELSFQRLMGIGDASKIHKALGDVLGGLDAVPNYDEQIADGTVRYQELNARMQTLSEKATALKQQRAAIPTRKTIEENRTTIQAQLSTIDAWTTTASSIDKLSEVVASLKKSLIGIPHDATELAAYDYEIDSLKARAAAIVQYTYAEDAWRKCGEAIIALGSQPYAPEELTATKSEYDRLTAELNKMLGRHKLHGDLLSAISRADGDAKQCPVCGSEITDVTALRDRLTAILKGLETTGKQMRADQSATQSKYTAMDTAFRRYQDEYASLTAAYKQADSTLSKLTKDSATLEEVNGKLNKLHAARQALIDNITRRTALKTRIETEQKHLDDLCRNEDSIHKTLTEFGITDTSPAGLSDFRARIIQDKETWDKQETVLRQLDTDLARFDGTVNELVRTTQALEKTLIDLGSRRASQATRKNALDVIAAVRNWFHYTNGPHTLSASVLSTMNQEVNKFLAQFSAEYTVEPADDSLGFKYRMNDDPTGVAHDATMLSGGQKIQLALAFRFAVYCVFAGKLGLLSLDEPTVHLDATNVSHFCDVLQKVRKVAKGMNLQVLVATHEPSVAQFVDTTIDINKLKK